MPDSWTAWRPSSKVSKLEEMRVCGEPPNSPLILAAHLGPNVAAGPGSRMGGPAAPSDAARAQAPPEGHSHSRGAGPPKPPLKPFRVPSQLQRQGPGPRALAVPPRFPITSPHPGSIWK